MLFRSSDAGGLAGLSGSPGLLDSPSFDILYDSFQSNHMRLFEISLISSTHSHTIANVRFTRSKVKKTIYHASIER